MTTGHDRAIKYFAWSLPLLAPVGLAIPIFVINRPTLLIPALYAIPAMVAAPVLYHLSRPWNPHFEPRVSIPYQIILSSFIFLFSLSIIFGVQHPRPRLFHIVLSTSIILIILAVTRFNSQWIPLAMGSSVAFIYHVSTTLTSGLFIGSGDAVAIWIGVKNTIQAGTIAGTAGYGKFPFFYSIVSQIAAITGLNANVSMYGFGAISLAATVWFIAFFALSINVISRRQIGIIAVAAILMYAFYYIGLYSIPRTTVSQVAILYLSVVLSLLTNQRNLNSRWATILISFGLAVVFYHKVGIIWIYTILGIFGFIWFLQLRTQEDYSISMNSLQSNTAPLLVFAVIPAVWTHIMSDTKIIPWIIALFSGYSGSGGYSRNFVLSEPWGLLSTFAGSSITLILALLAIFIATRSTNFRLRTVALCGAILIPFYYPGPLHASSTIMGAVSIYRFAKFIIPIISVLIAVGLIRFLAINNRAVRAMMVILIISAGVATFANDLYARDNPISQTGTFKNYVTEEEQTAMEFTVRQPLTLTSDVQGYGYLQKRWHLTEGWGGTERLQPVYGTYEGTKCTIHILFRGTELNKRGQLIFPSETIHSIGEVNPSIRSKLYSTGDNIIFGPCR